jgi:hypothetical protein
MKLPYLENAYVPESKVVKYLLNLEHKQGGKDKAVFFMRFGFTIDAWEVLQQALIAHAAAHEVASTLTLPDRTHYVIDGEIDSPDGRNPRIRSVWVIETNSTAPRFVSAYPV